MNSKEKRKDTVFVDDPKVKYPSAEFLHGVCIFDYQRVLDTYDKIYEKTNIALGFSGVILLVIMSSLDYTIIKRIATATNIELFSILALLLCSAGSASCIIWAVTQLLFLMRSKAITVMDSISIRNEELYKESNEDAALWMIDKYTKAINDIRPQIQKKQKSFDSAVVKIIISIVLFAVVLLIQKGL